MRKNIIDVLNENEKENIEQILQGIADEFKKDNDPLSSRELAYMRMGVTTAVKCMNAIYEKLGG